MYLDKEVEEVTDPWGTEEVTFTTGVWDLVSTSDQHSCPRPRHPTPVETPWRFPTSTCPRGFRPLVSSDPCAPFVRFYLTNRVGGTFTLSRLTTRDGSYHTMSTRPRYYGHEPPVTRRTRSTGNLVLFLQNDDTGERSFY